MRLLLICFMMMISLNSCIIHRSQQKQSSNVFEQIDFQALMKRYMSKEKSSPIEGIYSVSGVVTKRGKGLIGGDPEKEKTKDRRDNYAQVAIIRDLGDHGRDYLEISLDKEKQSSYSVVGEFKVAESGNILVYKHFDSKGKPVTFTFTADKSAETLEGVRVEVEGNTTVTYKLNYVKLSSPRN